MTEYGHEIQQRGERFAERITNSVMTTATARYSMILTTFLILTIIIPGGSWAVVRLVAINDRIADRQEQMAREFVVLQTQVLNIVSAQVSNSKNIGDRIDSGEKTIHDRINVQATWMQQLGQKIDELSKYVYTKVR